MNRQAMFGGIDKATGSDMRATRIAQQPDLQGVGRGLHHMVQGQVHLGKPFRIDLHLKHLKLLAPYGDVGDTGNTQ